MISDALVFLKDRLNAHFKAGQALDVSQEDPVVFLDGQNMEPLTFKLGAISVLLINIEEENTLRPKQPIKNAGCTCQCTAYSKCADDHFINVDPH